MGTAGASVESSSTLSVKDAYEYCARLAKSHYENFTIASWLMPREMRPPMHAIYAYARMADDFADEEHDLGKLDQWERELDLCYAGTPRHPVFVALADTVRRYDIPREPFADLLVAFRSDVNFRGFETLDDILATYTRYSANPVGRLVLRIAGHDRPELDAASDAVCTALQLTNFWQDVEVDWAKGRLYIPSSTWQAAGALESDLAARRVTPAWGEALKEAVGRTRALFQAGAPVCDGVRGRLRWELRATWLGGTRILDKLEAANFDLFAHRPKLTAMDAPGLLWRTATWSRVASER